MPLDSAQSFTAHPVRTRDATRQRPVTRLLSAGLSGPGGAAILTFLVARR